VTNAIILNHIESSIHTKKEILKNSVLLETVDKVCDLTINAYNKGNKTLFAGNGGSAADAQHLAAEFVSKYAFDRRGLPSMSLSSDSSIVTAIGNDYGYSELFSRQLQANGSSGDVFFAITTSGKSANILNAVKVCKKLGIFSVVLTGSAETELTSCSDYCLSVPSDTTAIIQEAHIMLGHIICNSVESSIFKS